jgi:predicted AAA+ superfamily ATPase
MAKIARHLLPRVRRDLAQKMEFLAGPRQAGKTTLARSLNGGSAGHLNWDVAENRERILKGDLLKWVHFEQDTAGRELDLRYFRDVDRREVDFVVTERGRPIKLVERKLSDTDVDSGLRYLRAKFPSVEAWQISASGYKNYQTPDGIRVAPAIELLKELA